MTALWICLLIWLCIALSANAIFMWQLIKIGKECRKLDSDILEIKKGIS